MLPLAAGLVIGGLSVAQSIAGNIATSEAASSQYRANKLFIERDQKVLNEQLKNAGVDVNNELGMALSDILIQTEQVASQLTSKQAETNVYGNSARRQQLAVAMQKELASDSVIQKAESKMTDVQTKLTEVKYQTEAKHMQNIQGYNQMMSSVQSPFEIIAKGVGAGLSAYSTGSAINTAEATLAAQTAQLADLQAGAKLLDNNSGLFSEMFPFLAKSNIYNG